MLKEYQKDVVRDLSDFFQEIDEAGKIFERTPDLKEILGSPLNLIYSKKYKHFIDKPTTGNGVPYPRICIKIPTGGGKTLLAVEAIRGYKSILDKQKFGLVIWITHREQIYRQTIENLQNRSHPYRQLLDQVSGNRTLILEKGQLLRRQDVENNLVIMMLMIQSASRESNKLFADSGYVDFFPGEERFDLHELMLKQFPNLDRTDETLFGHMQIKTSLGNVIRTQSPLIIVDELHTMFSEKAKQVLNGLNPKLVLGLSATPTADMNIVSSVTGRQLEREEMIKLDMHLFAPAVNGDWQTMLSAIRTKRDELEQTALTLYLNSGVYIRPIALIQAERTGRDQRGNGFVHSEDVRDYLVELGVPRHQIAVKSSSMDEIKAQKLLSRSSEIRFIITKEALKEGWDCSFAYILGVIPNLQSNTSVTQLVGRVLRQPYARKTGVKVLDESYVYFANGNSEEVLNQVRNGFEIEGLGELSANVVFGGTETPLPYQSRRVEIKTEIRDLHSGSLFLPVWLRKEKESFRRFSYKIDIFSQIDWLGIDYDTWLQEFKSTIGKQKTVQLEYVLGLSQGEQELREMSETTLAKFDPHYLTRRIVDTVSNAFIAYELSERLYRALSSEFSEETLGRDAGYIAREFEKLLMDYRSNQEEEIFRRLVEANEVVLGITDDKTLGFSFPEYDFVSNIFPNSYRHCLYQDVDTQSLNNLEKSVISLIEDSPKVLWWARNKARGQGWYFVQGWRESKIWPDFIVAKRGNSDDVEITYVLESKGEQLIGNADTQYKSQVFELLNSQDSKLKLIFRTTTNNLQDKIEYSLVPQSEAERIIREKLRDNL